MQQEELTLESPAISSIELAEVALDLSSGGQPACWEIVNSSGYTHVAYNPTLNLYYKEFFSRSPLEQLKALVRGSRGTRARLNSDKLVAAGFPAPTNVAWGSLPGSSEYLFTQGAQGKGVSTWLKNSVGGATKAELVQKRQLLSQLGSFIGHLHARGFIHGDLRASNIIANLSGSQFSFTLIDNERTTSHRSAPGKLILKNIMQLNMLLPVDITITDRWRFFNAWSDAMESYNVLEARVLGLEAYHWAMRRLAAKRKI
ncbi:MAG: lipopolysaccharide kinase InaA family protein [Halioglobus sp.]